MTTTGGKVESMTEEKQVELKIDIASTPEIAKGEFANLVMLTTHDDECRLDFMFVDRVAEGDEGAKKGYLVARVSLPPSQLAALGDMIDGQIGRAE